MKTVLLASLLMLAVILSGCQEQQTTWGQGDPPADWQNMFGDTNIARLDFVQTNTINRHNALIYGMDTKDPDGKNIHKRGLIERVTALEGLTERIKALEDSVESKATKLEIEAAISYYKGISSDASPDIIVKANPDIVIEGAPGLLICEHTDPNE